MLDFQSFTSFHGLATISNLIESIANLQVQKIFLSKHPTKSSTKGIFPTQNFNK